MILFTKKKFLPLKGFGFEKPDSILLYKYPHNFVKCYEFTHCFLKNQYFNYLSIASYVRLP